jgi:hypothetical protein
MKSLTGMLGITAYEAPTDLTDRLRKLEAVARLAAEGWGRWETMCAQQEALRAAGRGVHSHPRDAFESYLDALKTDAEEALGK